MGKRNKKQSFVQALIDEADELEKELAQAKAIGWSEEGRRLDDELDFDNHNFGDITEEEE